MRWLCGLKMRRAAKPEFFRQVAQACGAEMLNAVRFGALALALGCMIGNAL